MSGSGIRTAMDAPGQPGRYGRYALIELIGRGGMAEVFRASARDPSGQEQVCVVKRIRADKQQSVAIAQMIADEARIMSALRHPCVVEIYEYGFVDGACFIAMEYLTGRDLSSVLDGLEQRQAVLPLSLAAYIAHEIARGLGYAHAMADPEGRPLGIVHRDVSPSNVMVLLEGQVKILDFGIAKATRLFAEDRTIPGRIKGKLSYIAPEQLNGQTIDARTDVFSLGAVLWQMLTGHKLFSPQRLVEEQPIRPPSLLRPDIPRRLEAVVMRALEPEPARRYPSAGALAHDLAPFLRSLKFERKNLARLMDGLFAEGRVQSGRHEQPEDGGFTLVTRPRGFDEEGRGREETTRSRIVRAARAAGRRLAGAVRGRWEEPTTTPMVVEPRTTPVPPVSARPPVTPRPGTRGPRLGLRHVAVVLLFAILTFAAGALWRSSLAPAGGAGTVPSASGSASELSGALAHDETGL